MTDNEKKDPRGQVWATCEHSINLLVEYLDGTLPPEEKASLDRHFKACPPCIDFVRKYRSTPGVCKKALVEEIPDEMAKRLTSFLRLKVGGSG